MFLLFIRRLAACLFISLLAGAPAVVQAQTNYYSANGNEYSVIGSLPGDQVFPDAAVTTAGGFLVWQDNITDGSGWGISARRLDSTLSGTLGTFRVNVDGASDQSNPRVAMLKNNGAVFVWQGGKTSQEQVCARFLTPSNTWLMTNDILVNTPPATNSPVVVYVTATNTVTTITTNWDHGSIAGYSTNFTTTVTTTATTNFVGNAGSFHVNPAVAVLNNSNIVVVWSSFNQAGSNSVQDVYGQIISPAGVKVGGEFLINQFTSYNQRNPTVAALQNGGFAVVWVSEQQRSVAPALGANTDYVGSGATVIPSADIYARLYSSNAVAQGGEFLVDTASNPCASPAVAVASDGTFMVTWCARNLADSNSSLDIYARNFSSAGVGGTPVLVNSHLYGDQYQPRISAVSHDYLIVWTSLGQDGSREGVFGQLVHEGGALVGGEFQFNTTVVSQQMQPVIVSDGLSQFLAVWTSFGGLPNSFDLVAQRYLNVSAILQPMAAPFVYAPFTVSNGVYQPQLQVSWPPLLGISVSNYEVYLDGSSVPVALTSSNVWTMSAANGLTTSSTHSFRVDYTTTDGRTSPLSPSASGTTWNGLNWGGIPFEWMTQYYGTDISKWPGATADGDGDGMGTLQEFSSGTIPTNSASVLQVQLAKTAQGLFLNWASQPGLTYQVQVSTNLTTWSNLGSARFAAGNSDAIYVGTGAVGYYRVVLLR